MTENKLVEMVNAAPGTRGARQWTFRDDNARHYHGQVSLGEDPMYLTLLWRSNSAGQVHRVGIFRLPRRELMAKGFIRQDSADTVRVRFCRRDTSIYLQVRNGEPAMHVADLPVDPD